MTSFRRLPFVLAVLLLLPSVVSAAAVEVLGTPFPSDVYTTPDPSHLTGLRVNLPSPDCASHPSDCADNAVLNTLDGFNLQPRISIAFTDAIDPASISSANVYLVSLGSTTDGTGAGKVVGINQAVWEPAANTLHVESDAQLDQHTRYLLVITRGIRDAAGNPLAKTTFQHDLNFGQTKDPALKAYRKELLDALDALGLDPDTLAGVSIFTTQSATAVLQKIRAQIKAQTPAPAVMHGSFARATITSIVWKRQVGTATFATPSFNLLLLDPAAVGTVAFGQFQSPDYENALKFIPPVGTRTGVPAVLGTNTLQFNLILPLSAAPPGGYPVVIFGHGFTDSKQGAPNAVAATLAANGLATIAINVVGHGGGALGTITVNTTVGSAAPFPDGGRGFDQNGDGVIDSTEGSSALAPLIGNRDGLRQTTVDIMQLIRLIQTGGIPGLSTTRIYYAGQSFGGIYGGILLGVEPDIRAGVLNVPGGPIVEIARLSPSFRGLVALALGARTPSLLNGGSFGFTENIPLRNKPILIDVVDGASAIQKNVDDTEWVSQSGNPNAYAPHIRNSPLAGDGTPVIIQFAKGDRTVPNPTATALIRAGDLADRATFFRNDLNLPAVNPHTFLTFGVGVAPAIEAQTQMAIFLASDGAVTVDPDGPPPAGVLFEVPINGPLPEELNF
jgi:hypothetical protein